MATNQKAFFLDRQCVSTITPVRTQNTKSESIKHQNTILTECPKATRKTTTTLPIPSQNDNLAGNKHVYECRNTNTTIAAKVTCLVDRIVASDFVYETTFAIVNVGVTYFSVNTHIGIFGT